MAESYPTHRPDVEVLFGRGLAGIGHRIDMVMQASSTLVASGRAPWHGSIVMVGPTADGGSAWSRARKQALELRHDLNAILRARPSDYDAIQVRDKFLIAALVVLIAKIRGMKFFYWMSFPMPEADIANARAGHAFIPIVSLLRGKLTGWLLYRWILPNADHIFVQSERMKQAVSEAGIRAVAMTPVPMGVDPNDLPQARADNGRPMPRALRIGYLGTLDASRRLEVLVETLAILHRQGTPASLLLVGDSVNRQDRESLTELAETLGLGPHVEITGMLPRREAMQRILAVDIAVSPIHRSPILDVGSPTKLVEYLAMRLPVVANSHPEQRQILSETRAGVCVPWGARHFARGIRWLARQTAATRAEMADRGQAWVMTHRAYGNLSRNLEARYLELLEDRPTVAS